MTTAYEQLKAMSEACIDNTPHQVESLAIDVGELTVSDELGGEGLPPVGAECEILDVGGESTLGVGEIYLVDGRKVFILSKGIKDYPEESVIVGFDGDINLYVMWVNDDDNRFRKIESPQDKAKRERLESAYDLYITQCISGDCDRFTYDEFIKEEYVTKLWLAIVDKTNYRKGE